MSLEQLSLKLRFPFIIRITGLLSIILSISLFFILPRFTGETAQEDYDQIITHLKKLNYCNLNKYFKIKDISKIVFYMKQDKKNKDSKINLILLKSISKPLLDKSFKETEIRSFLKSLIY